jgi:two-component system chemotaxis response regulator CheV
MAETNILLQSGTNEVEIIEFYLTRNDNVDKKSIHYLGVNVAKVREIITMPKITALAQAPAGVAGIFNSRNTVTPILDLGQILFGTKYEGDKCKLIITEFNNMQLGLIVNDVKTIHRISWTRVESADVVTQFFPDQSTIVGIVKMEDRNILLIDIEKIISDINPKLGIEGIADTEIERKKSSDYIIFSAEDSNVIRKMLTDRLKLVGYKYKSFTDGQEAWDELERISREVAAGKNINEFVDLVITDIEMPRLDGLTLTKRIKETPALSKLPVLVFSSIVSDDLYHKGVTVGADAQLTKPQIGLLLDTIKALLEKNRT